MFVQDRWRVNDRLAFELGLRSDRDDIVEKVNYSPRAGMSVSLLPNGRGILRGGFGKFAERTPLAVGAFTRYDVQTVTRFAANGTPLGPAVTFTQTIGDVLKTPESIVQAIAWDQRFGRLFFLKVVYLHREGSHAYIVDPDVSGGLTLSSAGASKYWEFETTGRFLASEHRNLSVSYVRSKSTRDLNDYDQFYGNFRNPIIRANANSLSPTDVPNRMIVRGTWGVGADGSSRRFTSRGLDSRFPPLTSIRISSASETAPDGCRRCRRSTSRSRATCVFGNTASPAA